MLRARPGVPPLVHDRGFRPFSPHIFAPMTRKTIGMFVNRQMISFASALALTAGLLISVNPAVAAAAPAADPCPWVASTATPEVRAAAVLQQMTLDEKLSMTHGSSAVAGYAGSVAAIPRLCIPSLTLN